MPMLPEFEDPMARPRYTGLATFMRASYREDPEGVDIGLIGVPFDGGVTNRIGTRHGPREIRNQSSLMRKINQASGVLQRVVNSQRQASEFRDRTVPPAYETLPSIRAEN